MACNDNWFTELTHTLIFQTWFSFPVRYVNIFTRVPYNSHKLSLVSPTWRWFIVGSLQVLQLFQGHVRTMEVLLRWVIFSDGNLRRKNLVEPSMLIDLATWVLFISFEHVWTIVSESSGLSSIGSQESSMGHGQWGNPWLWGYPKILCETQRKKLLVCIKWVLTPVVSDNGAFVLPTISVTVRLHDAKRCWGTM